MKKDVYCIGDVHGKFGQLESKVNGYVNTDFIALGDIGLGFHHSDVYDEWFPDWNNYLKSKNNTVYFFRGNHDDPSFWFENKFNLSNIKLVQDYEVLELNKRKILCVGGALSVDRFYRTKGKTYWEDEEFVYDEEKINTMKGIDIVLTHSAPDFFKPRGYDNPFLQGFYNVDKNLRNDLIIERELMRRMYDILTEKDLFEQKNNITHWLYGHFHSSTKEIHDGIECRCLDELEFHKIM